MISAKSKTQEELDFLMKLEEVMDDEVSVASKHNMPCADPEGGGRGSGPPPWKITKI